MALELYDGALEGISGKYYDDKIEDEELEKFEKGFLTE